MSVIFPIVIITIVLRDASKKNVITTCHTLTSDLRAMIAGWEELEVEGPPEKTSSKSIKRVP